MPGFDDDGRYRVNTKSSARTPKAPDQQFTIGQLATVQSLTVPTGAQTANIQNNTTQAIRYRDTGQLPTATVGMRILSGDSLAYDGDLSLFRLIREADGTGTVDIAFYA